MNCCEGVWNLSVNPSCEEAGDGPSQSLSTSLDRPTDVQDLYDSISAGDHPEWTLAIQVLDPADEDK